MLDHLYAKPHERLDCHTDRVLYATLALRDRYEPALQLGDAFWEDATITALFHDFGKATGNFQETMERARKNQKPNWERHIRHEFISGMLLVFHTLFSNRSRLDIEPNPAQLLAIFSHHKSLEDNLFNDQTPFPFLLGQSDALRFIDYVRTRIAEHAQNKLDYLDQITDAVDCIKQVCEDGCGRLGQLVIDKDDAFSIIWKAIKQRDGYNFRDTYILHKAILNIADWSASGHRELEKALHYTPDELKAKLKERAERQKRTFDDWREFQRDSLVPGNVLAIAPTGSGKTEASLLWASQREGWEKILFLLPTRVTANALYRRLDDYFGNTDEATSESYTAVVHSSAKMFRQDLDKNYDELSYYRESGFFKAVTVATVDQMLTQGFNLGWWEMKTFHLFRAKVIIDEVHAYQPYTLGLLVASIIYLRKNWQTEFYVMTATMPTQLRAILTDALGGDANITVRQDKELLNKARNTYRVVDKPIDDLSKEIKGRLKAGKKVLLVVNTVDEAIRLYDSYTDYDRLVYHSRFTVQDRNAKEKLILDREDEPSGKAFLLIATQVVEVSLDIDYDYLYSENAPMDAIIQRAGRVNRKRDDTKETEVIIYPHREESQRIYEEAKKSGKPAYPVLSKTWDVLKRYDGQKLSEAQLLTMVDDVYADWAIAEDDSFRDAKIKYREVQADTLIFVQDNNNDDEKAYTREGLDTVNIIPAQYAYHLNGQSARMKSKHEVTIRNNRYQQAKRNSQISPDAVHEWFKYLDCDYDFEKGLRFKERESTPLTAHH
ncbi:CRISPR-associated helicase Cas3' [uncultured Spirosoma sp.]|uniref:CRISPR-associated helicase Cas3' n=1 Tax=uncultured Spirosoma sp. TaxID=278208 RepID=UPI00258794F7|nr:CRISPR-associated helicase Cas3' [uncultured Spirosoma sp.]